MKDNISLEKKDNIDSGTPDLLRPAPCLWIVIPCYNEEEVLPITMPKFLCKLKDLIEKEDIRPDSRILFVNDGSGDKTWDLIQEFAKENENILGMSQSRNRGHQSTVLAGLMEAKDYCDVAISIDCDGQDDINAMDQMIREYRGGCDIVYGVRSSRKKDTWFKRSTAQNYYRFLHWMGAEVVYNHADYRLTSARVLRHLADYKEVNLYLRGMFPLVGFKSTSVSYERSEREAGESHYPLRKMLALAFDGITSLSIKPIRLISGFGTLVSVLGFVGIIWAIVANIMGYTVTGWSSTICVICFLGGIQLLSLGVIGEYVGKTYMETKGRPRYIISDRTWEENKEEARTPESDLKSDKRP